jgi:hypothetical protein
VIDAVKRTVCIAPAKCAALEPAPILL